MRKISLKLSSCLVLICLGLVTSWAKADSAMGGQSLIQRDRTYEENLRWENSGDKTMTPARALRWIKGMRGSAIYSAGGPAQFQPIVNVVNSHVRVIAAIAYKF